MKKSKSAKATELQRVAPSVPYYRVTLSGEEKKSWPVKILACLPVAILAVPFLGSSAFAQKVNVKVNGWLGIDSVRDLNTIVEPVKSSGFDYILASHTNNSHTNAAGSSHHTNSAERHVDVPSEVGHADFIKPHSDSHMNTPHTNVPHENVVTPDTGTEGA